MAGDWIKMRIDLQSHPKVVRILSATKADKFRVIGGLHAVWSVFDTHSENGALHGYTPEALDHIIGWDGFAQAMIAVGWLEYDGAETLAMPEFDEHNGQSAKRRAEDQKRKRNARKHPQSVTSDCGQSADKVRTESGLEKRREEYTYTTPLTPLSQGGMPDGDFQSDQEQATLEKKPGRKKSQAVSLQTFLQKCRDEGVKPIPVDDPIFDFADSVGIPHDWLRLAWMEFKTRFGDNRTRKSDWRKHFRNAVRGNWFKLWFAGENGMQLSSQGRILSEAHREAA